MRKKNCNTDVVTSQMNFYHWGHTGMDGMPCYQSNSATLYICRNWKARQSLQETKSLGSPLRPSRQHEDMRPVWSMKQVNLWRRILVSHHLRQGNLLTLSLPVPPPMMWTFHISPTLTSVTLNLCQGSDVQPRWASHIDPMTPGM